MRYTWPKGKRSAAVLSFDFFFVPPYLSFAVSDTEYLITFAVMLAVVLVISSMVAAFETPALATRMSRRSPMMLRACLVSLPAPSAESSLAASASSRSTRCRMRRSCPPPS